MSKLFSLDNALEALATLVALGAGLGVLQTFIIGKHFVIPTRNVKDCTLHCDISPIFKPFVRIIPISFLITFFQSKLFYIHHLF